MHFPELSVFCPRPFLPNLRLVNLVLTLIWSLACDLDVQEKLTRTYMQGLFCFWGQSFVISYSAFEKKSPNFDRLGTKQRAAFSPGILQKHRGYSDCEWPDILQTQATLMHIVSECCSAEI
ncbi:unnamed protein product [Boreogadus saida]